MQGMLTERRHEATALGLSEQLSAKDFTLKVGGSIEAAKVTDDQ